MNLDEALDMIKRAVGARPYDGYIRDSLGWVYYRLGRYDEAVDGDGARGRADAARPGAERSPRRHLLGRRARSAKREFQWRRALSFMTDDTDLEELNPDRIRRKLEVGLDVVLEEEGGEPINAMMSRTFAPAKINLTLHVTGQRADGYHLLDSLVAFADVGDRVRVMPAETTTLEVTGPMAAGVPTDETNLVRARPPGCSICRSRSRSTSTCRWRRGSAAARPTRRRRCCALADLTGTTTLPEGATELGADVRVCLMRQAARMRGIGDDVEPVEGMPELLRGARQPGRRRFRPPRCSRRSTTRPTPPMPKRIPRWRAGWSAIDWIAKQRNDLEAPAIAAVAPVIGEVLDALRGAARRPVRADVGVRARPALPCSKTGPRPTQAAEALAEAHPDWWVTAATLR